MEMYIITNLVFIVAVLVEYLLVLNPSNILMWVLQHHHLRWNNVPAVKEDMTMTRTRTRKRNQQKKVVASNSTGSHRIDKWARIIVPFMYVLFNIIYFSYFLNM